MSFLSIAFLFALPLALAPVLLHLFDRQRKVVIEWGAMQFLAEAARRRTSTRRLQQWLLLLLRSLAVLCLVLALARPLVNSNWMGGVDRSDTILIIDNSMSMIRPDADGTALFQAALQKAGVELDQISASDSVRVLLASPYPIWLNSASLRANSDVQTTIREQLAALQPTLTRSDLLAATFTAVQTELIPGTKRRRVVMITDSQAADWSASDEKSWNQLRTLLQSSVVPTEFDVVSLTPRQNSATNVAINQIHGNRTQVGARQIVTLAAQIQNHGSSPSDPSLMQWKVSGTETHQSDIPSLAPGAIHEAIWKHSFPDLGIYPVVGELAIDDALIPDNRETVIIEVVDHIPVLVVESAPEASEVMQDAFFVQAAMGWVNGEPLATQGVFVPTLVKPDRLEQIELHDYRAVVIPNLEDVSEEVVKKLQGYVADGGGLWVALGPRTDLERFNQYFFEDSNGIAPLAVDRIVEESDSNEQKTLIDPFVTSHPAIASLADNSRLDTGTIAVSRRIRFSPPLQGLTPSVLLNLTNGEPLVVEKTTGRGRTIIQGVPLRLQWSDLAKSQAFVVIVQDWLNYLTQPLATRHNLIIGEPISMHLTGNEAQEATLKTPQGDDIELTADSTVGGTTFRTSRTMQPGDYSLEVGLSGDKIPFHVQRDARESNLTPLSTSEQQLISSSTRLGQAIISESLNRATPTDPVWPLLLTLLAGLIVAELLLSGMMSRGRFGTDPIAETSEHMAETQTELAGQFPMEHRTRTDRRIDLNEPKI